MLATYPQFSPQPLMATPFGAALFASPGLHAANGLFGQEPGFASFVPPSVPFTPFAASHPLAQTYAMTAQTYPFLQVPVQTPYAVAQQLVVALAQLAQQISIQSVVNQQIGSALQQLTQQIQAHTLPALPGFGIGQPYAQIGSPFAGATSPFIGTPGVYQPAWQAWGGQRTQTIQ